MMRSWASPGAAAAPGGSGVAGPGQCCPLAAAAPAAGPALLGSPPHLQDVSPAAVSLARHRNSLPPSALSAVGILAARGTGISVGTFHGSEGERLVACLMTVIPSCCLSPGNTQHLPARQKLGASLGSPGHETAVVKGQGLYSVLGWKGCHRALCVQRILGEEAKGKHGATKASVQVSSLTVSKDSPRIM